MRPWTIAILIATIAIFAGIVIINIPYQVKTDIALDNNELLEFRELQGLSGELFDIIIYENGTVRYIGFLTARTNPADAIYTEILPEEDLTALKDYLGAGKFTLEKTTLLKEWAKNRSTCHDCGGSSFFVHKGSTTVVVLPDDFLYGEMTKIKLRQEKSVLQQ